MTVRDPILEEAIYSVHEAARLLNMRAPKLRHWLEGVTVGGTSYPPVIRKAAEGTDTLTWEEFAEAGFLREYREDKRVSLQYLRAFVDGLREEFGVLHPLAHFQPLVESRKRKLRVPLADGDLLDEHWQTAWAIALDSFLEKVEFDPQGLAARFYPLGKTKTVVIDPRSQFGIPQVRGIRTEIVVESYSEIGNEIVVAREWGIDVDDVRAALQWEMKTAKAA